MNRGFLSRLQQAHRFLDESESILAHLRVLLNTPKGDSVTVPEFGMLDLSDLLQQVPFAIPQIQKSVRETIEKFEPRLTHVRVQYVPSEDLLTLHFVISARLKSRPQVPFQLNTKVLSTGKFKVSTNRNHI